MFKRYIISGMAAALTLAGCGVGGTVEDRVAAAQARNDGPAMWVVKDYDSTLYLYGTVHLLPDDMEWQKQDMKDAFAEAGTIFFELDTRTDAQLNANQITQSLGFYTDGTRLSDDLDEYQKLLLEAASNNGDISLAAIESMKPWLASEFLTISAAIVGGLSPELSADAALKHRADRLQKNVIFLDTAEQQIRASADQPEFVQKMVLTDTLERFNGLKDQLVDIAELWAVGAVQELEPKTVSVIQSQAPEMYNTLILERNRRWTTEFMRFLEDSGTGFAAVGISHLLGEDSVQAMLRDQGYTVSRYYAFQGENVIRPIDLSTSN